MSLPERITPTVPSFYRYQSAEHLEWLKPVLLEHQIYVPTVRELNDPADGRPKLSPLSAENMIKFLHEPSVNPTWTLQRQIHNLNVLTFNVHLHGTEALMRQMAKQLYAHTEQYRIFSMSKRFDNMGLWAKYAANHTGYCLEFANDGPLFSQALEVVYGDDFPMDVSNKEHRKAYFFYCKRPEWSNEEEIRLISLPFTGQTVKIEPRWLTRIILGEKMPDTNRNQIREWCEQREPRLPIVRARFDELLRVMNLDKP